MEKGFELCLAFKNSFSDKIILLDKIKSHTVGAQIKWEGNYPVLKPGMSSQLRITCTEETSKMTVAGYVVFAQGMPHFFFELDYISRLLFTVAGPIYPMFTIEEDFNNTASIKKYVLTIMQPPKSAEDEPATAPQADE